MNELTHKPYFAVEGFDGAYESPFEAVEAALDYWLCGGDERPDTVKIEVYKEQRAHVFDGDIKELAYATTEDLALAEREDFEESMRLIGERLTWALETCHTGAFISDLRHLAVRVIEVDDEWIIDLCDEDLLRIWWGMETARMRGGE